MSSSSSVISRVGGYAPGWLADYATVGSALHANFSALGPFSTGDVTVGVTYLWEIERNKRAEAGVSEDPGIGPGPSFDELDDLRALCVATEVRSVLSPSFFFFFCSFHACFFFPVSVLPVVQASQHRTAFIPKTTQAAYFAERDHLRKHVGRLGHEVLYSVHKSQFQEPAHYISLRRETGDVHFVIRGKVSNTCTSTSTSNCQLRQLTSTSTRVLLVPSIPYLYLHASSHVTKEEKKNTLLTWTNHTPILSH